MDFLNVKPDSIVGIPTSILRNELQDLEDSIVESGIVLPTMLRRTEPKPASQTLAAPGYEALADVLKRAFDQAAIGKGRDRHANGEPFHEQVMQTGAQRFGVGSLLFQAFKKSEESQRLPLDRAVAELLGAINYLAGAVIALESAESNCSTSPTIQP